jgi:hypothetical protein
MSNRTIKTKRGDAVGIFVKGSQREESQRVSREAERKRFVGGDFEEDLYVRRGGVIRFFDLGTRLRSVPPATTFDRMRIRSVGEVSVPEQHDGWFNEYVEMALDLVHDINHHEVTTAEAVSHTVEIMGSLGGGDPMDPLETSPANMSGRELAHCMPLPYHAEWLWADAVLYNDSVEKRYVIGVDGERPFVNSTFDGPLSSEGKWKKLEAAPEEENWNPLNDITGDGELRAPFSGKKIKIDSAAFYESFDSGDASLYKWTSGSSFGSPEVTVPSLSGKLIRVFLVPRISHFGVGMSTVLNTGDITSLVNPSATTRLSVYPGIGQLHWIGTTSNGRRNYWVTRGFVRSMSASIERSPEFIVSRIPQDTAVLAIFGASAIVARRNSIFVHFSFDIYARLGQLVGIVEISGNPYFCWLKADDINHEQKTNTLGGGPVILTPRASMPHVNWNATPTDLYTGADDTTTTVPNDTHAFQDPIL